ncbi:MAG: hypothetical protein EXS16_04160 [Gemmataceae bacterium]|nr:hypothetical protein [Gemmataceae bacterium]
MKALSLVALGVAVCSAAATAWLLLDAAEDRKQVARLTQEIDTLKLELGKPRFGPNAGTAPNPVDESLVVVPKGFDEKLFQILRCPESLTLVRLATRKELDSVNERIKAGQLKTWAGKVVSKSVNAMLVRQDHKIGYRFEGAAPVMIIEEALVLDETVGKPDPEKYRKNIPISTSRPG